MSATRVTATIALIAAVVVATFAGGWSVLFRPNDQKSLRYILWKQGFQTEDLEDASEAMSVDPHSNDFVVGKTPEQLGKWFPLQTLQQTSQWNREYYEGTHWRGSRVMFIKGTQWMITFDDHDRATELVPMKE